MIERRLGLSDLDFVLFAAQVKLGPFYRGMENGLAPASTGPLCSGIGDTITYSKNTSKFKIREYNSISAGLLIITDESGGGW